MTDRLTGILEERLEPWVAADRRFAEKFGRWTRPPTMRRYPLGQWVEDIHFRAEVPDILQAEAFVNRFPRDERSIVARICEFVTEEVALDKDAGDKTLKTFRLQLVRRLEGLGF